jgi:uncharacterized membrane-anchored protein
MRILSLLFFTVLSLLLLAPKTALAADGDPPREPVNIETYPWKSGPAPLSLPHGVEMQLPEGYRFLGMPHAGELMKKLGNLYNENLLGLVISENAEEEYFVSLRFDEEGFIKDDEKLDAKDLLDAIRDGEAEYNEERKKLGFGSIHAEGWQEEPRYDKASHHVVWALNVRGDQGTSVNLNTRILGRKGYASINLVTASDELSKYRANGVAILQATSFAQGHRYEDFDSSKDKVAEYGLTGLVLGGAGVGLAKAAKLGLLAKFWKGFVALLIAGKKGIVALFAAIAAFARKLFGKKPAPAPAADETDDTDADAESDPESESDSASA